MNFSRDQRPTPERSGVRQVWARSCREGPVAKEEDEMPEHKIGTQEDWQAARDELAKLEAEQAQRDEEIKKKRRELPWVPVEKEYEFDTEDGKKTLAELFDGRSQLLAYNVMFGPDYDNGACPGCTSLADGFDGGLVHLNHRDVTLICFSRAPIERLAAYKKRMGWQFPYVSTYNTDFAFDFGLAMTEEQARADPRGEGDDRQPSGVAPGMVGRRSGPSSRTVCARTPSWIAFARENGTVYHTYTVSAPDPFVAPVLQLPARPDAEGPARRAPRLAQGRVPRLTVRWTSPLPLGRLSRRGSGDFRSSSPRLREEVVRVRHLERLVRESILEIAELVAEVGAWLSGLTSAAVIAALFGVGVWSFYAMYAVFGVRLR